ncbi:MAG: DUF2147 domain-containing protein [Endomicrobia bacterium]|nr:DUF2147 domain-containing protein [Endomicrobiia bacterium]
MKKILMLVFLQIFCLSLAVHAAQVTGLWQTFYDGTNIPKSVIRIYEKDGLVHGEIVVTFRKDGAPDIIKNEKGEVICDISVRAENMRGRPPFCGLIVLKNLRPNNRGVYSGGTILNPENDRSYRAEIWVANDGNLKIRGRWGIFWRTMTAFPFTEEQLKSVFTL